MQDQRDLLLQRWAGAIDKAARAGALTGDPNKPIVIREIGTIAGPRAGAIEMDAGIHAGLLLRALGRDDGAVMRQFIPWTFTADPAVYLAGRFVRIEAGWPDALARKSISVAELNTRPNKPGYWLAGMNERGRAVILRLSDAAPHYLIAGTTGAGKSVALRSMIVQLARNGDHLILIDLKPEGLIGLDQLPGVLGPLATTLDDARAALAYAVAEMRRRYDTHDTTAPLWAVCVDEIQELSADAACVELIRQLTAQGRAARVHVILATQYPINDALGDATIKRNMTGRIALRVSDAKASEVSIGQSTPRADWLLGAGDAYTITPGNIQRTQIAYMEKREIARIAIAQPAISEWPAFVAEASLPSNGAATWTGKELAISLGAAYRQDGRPALIKALAAAGLSQPGGDRARRLLAIGREQLIALRKHGLDLCDRDTQD